MITLLRTVKDLIEAYDYVNGTVPNDKMSAVHKAVDAVELRMRSSDRRVIRTVKEHKVTYEAEGKKHNGIVFKGELYDVVYVNQRNLLATSRCPAKRVTHFPLNREFELWEYYSEDYNER